MWIFLAAACAGEGQPECSGWSTPLRLGQLARVELIEASGLAASRRDPGSFWSHNDLGDHAILYSVGPTGEDQGSLTLSVAGVSDWEDIAIGPGPDGNPWILVGDIGNNDLSRVEISLWRLPEPAMSGADLTTGDGDGYDLAWPDGPRDAEALLFDPSSNEIMLLTKEPGTATLYALRDLSDGAGVMVELGELDLGLSGVEDAEQVTGADISPGGDRIYIRTSSHVVVFDRQAGASVAETLAGPGCLVSPPDEENGEAIAALDDGFVTVGEGLNAPLWQVNAP